MRLAVVLALVGCGRIDFDPVERVFVDTVANGGFAQGTFGGTRIVEDDVVLGGTQGTFLSRIFDAGEPVTWTRLKWIPEAPYGVALPDNRGNEAYLAGGADMSENILLLHMELDGAQGVGALLVDSSGRNNEPAVVGAPMVPANGVFGGGLGDSDSAYLAIDLAQAAPAADFSFGTGDWTWMLWLRTSVPCVGVDSLANDTYIGADDNRAAGGEHVWFGCLHAADTNCATTGATDSRLGGTLISMSNTTDGGSYCGTRSITDGVFHHLAITKHGHQPATIETWIDGVREFSGPINFAVPFVWEDMKTWNLAGEPGSRVSSGEFDDIAIFRRAWSPSELRDAYLRGVRRLTVRARACDQPDCSDGTFGARFEAAGPGPGVEVDLGVHGRFIQYEMSMTGIADADGSPGVRRVELVADTLQ